MKKRSLFGNIALGTFALAFLLVVISFTTSSWLTSDKGARHNSMGLWTHCFSWQADSNSLYDRRFYVGCQDEIRGFSVPPYNRRVMTTTQVFFTFCFISVIIGAILSLLYFFYCSPDNKRFVLMLKVLSWNILIGASCGAIAILVFITQRDVYVWMPFHNNIYFGWSMYVGILGVIAMFVAGVYFWRDARIHARADISSVNRARAETPTVGHGQEQTVIVVK